MAVQAIDFGMTDAEFTQAKKDTREFVNGLFATGGYRAVENYAMECEELIRAGLATGIEKYRAFVCNNIIAMA